jgi:carboxymethylenebutenolidase
MSVAANSPGFPVYVAGSTDSTRALIVLQEGFGVNDHIRKTADRYIDDGYFVIAPHLYHRSGSPEVPYDDIEQAKELMSTLSESGLTNDLNATTNFLAGVGFTPASIGVVGFCMGGSVALFAATLGTVGAAVSYYGGGIATGRMGLPPLLEVAEGLRSPWLGLYGDLDAGIPVAEVEDLRTLTSELDVVTEIVRYPQAGHGFHCDARPRAYNKEASDDADERTREFLNAQLVPVRL